MDPLKNNVKEALEKNVYRELELDESGKNKFLQQIYQGERKVKKRQSHYTPWLAGMAAIIILIFLTLPLVGKLTNSNASIQSELSETFGHEVIIPEIDGYELTWVSLYKPKGVGMKDVSLTYAKNRGELDPKLGDPEKLMQWEEQNESELLYGPYTGGRQVSIRFQEGKVEMDGAKVKTMNGIDVQYQVIKGDAVTTYMAIVHSGVGFYQFEIFLVDGMTEAEADSIVSKFTKAL